MSAITKKGGGIFQGIRLLLYENTLPPIEEVVAATQASLTYQFVQTHWITSPSATLKGMSYFAMVMLGTPVRGISVTVI